MVFVDLRMVVVIKHTWVKTGETDAYADLRIS